MYEELIKRLRDNEHEIDCSLCDRDCCYTDGKVHGKCIIIEAADAIEGLSMKLHGDEAAIAGMKREIERMVVSGNKPRWIPVTERLPEDRVEVLVSSGMFAPLIEVAFYDGLFYSAWDGETEIAAVTHWMPLPEPPKEE